MAREPLTGSRIRERRVMAGIKQAELAKRSGISASYLNLIEHNRRRIGGKLLLSISAALGVEPQALTEGAEAALVATLREAADNMGLSAQEAERADEFASRFPGWADVLAGTRRRVTALEQTVEALSDRMSHDPHLAASMHELLTTAAAVRSTAAILAETETLQPEWRDRFHANINEDSRRLSDSAQALVTYLDTEAGAVDAASSPQEEVEAFLSAHDFSFAALEQGEASPANIEALVTAAPQLKTEPALYVARLVLRQVAADAKVLSLPALRDAVTAQGPDPLTLARSLNCPVAIVLRRMAALPELGCGLVVCDRSGSVIFRKSVEGFTVPRFGACCPLWPLFTVLGQPGLVTTERISQVGRSGAVFDCFVASEVLALPPQYNAAPQVQAVMLQIPADAGPAQQPKTVGATCRVCPQQDCTARREPSIMAGGL